MKWMRSLRILLYILSWVFTACRQRGLRKSLSLQANNYRRRQRELTLVSFSLILFSQYCFCYALLQTHASRCYQPIDFDTLFLLYKQNVASTYLIWNPIIDLRTKILKPFLNVLQTTIISYKCLKKTIRHSIDSWSSDVMCGMVTVSRIYC